MKTGWLVPIRFVLLILALIAFIPDSSLSAQVGKFTGVEGNVDVTVPGKAAKRVSVGEPVQVGDIIRTKSKSKCEVTFLDGNIVRFAENTRLRGYGISGGAESAEGDPESLPWQSAQYGTERASFHRIFPESQI